MKTYTIKPLVWETLPHGCFAEFLRDTYLITNPVPEHWSDYRLSGAHVCSFDTLEAAKAAAQAHYESRLMECLTETGDGG